MDKRGLMAIYQIIILILSCVAISYFIQADALSGQDKPPTTGTPTHGYSGEAYEWVFGEGTTASGTTGFSVSGIMQGALHAAVVYGMVQMLGSFFGLEDQQIDAIAKSVAAGVFVGESVVSLIGEGGALEEWALGEGEAWLGTHAKGVSLGAGVLVAAIMFYNSYKKITQETVTFTCEPWDAPTGGVNCEKCNKQGALPCSEYQCRSLGQSCQLLNDEASGEAKCVWVNRNDVGYPVIEPWEDALLEDHKYTPDNTISPPDRGVKIVDKTSVDGCVKAFTPLSFGIVLDEPAKCKVDYLRKANFDDMEFYFGGSSLFRYNHTQIMSLPGANAFEGENLTVQNNGNYELYIRCQDANGNANVANFAFKYCVDKGPDTTPPLIVTTNLLNDMPIAFGQQSLDLEVYINEPADCRWSRLDKSYEDMEEIMSCSRSIFEMNAQMLYKCSTTLTGLKDRVTNNFFFRCKDQPRALGSDRNVNSESHKFSLIGTQQLVIDSVGPSETIKDSTDIVKVTLTAQTSAGYNEGEAACYHSESGEEDSYTMFFETNSHIHSQELYLAEGTYEYYIKCIDLGGNSDIKTTQFTVDTDITSPIVVRVYHEEGYLKLTTNEGAICVYDTANCNYLFEDGIEITVLDDIDHFTNWNTNEDFHIKCEDEFGNQPAPNECSIIVRPGEI